MQDCGSLGSGACRWAGEAEAGRVGRNPEGNRGTRPGLEDLGSRLHLGWAPRDSGVVLGHSPGELTGRPGDSSGECPGWSWGPRGPQAQHLGWVGGISGQAD